MEKDRERFKTRVGPKDEEEGTWAGLKIRRSVSTSSIELLIALATELSQEIEPFPVSGYRKSASFPSRA